MGALAVAWGWFTKNPVAQWIAGIVLLFIGYNVWKRNVEHGVRRQEREAFEKKQAEAEAAIVKTIQENSDDFVTSSERVRARDAVVELPDGTRDLPGYHYRD